MARALRFLEPFLWVGLALFFLNRFGPQLSAWTGLGPPSGSAALAAPSFHLMTLDGAVLDSREMGGTVQVITFWATWCRVCRVELPSIQRVAEEWGDEDGVMVLGLSIDQGGAGVVRNYVTERGFTFPQALADRDTRWAFGGIPGVPTTFIVDSQGVVRHKLVGLTGPGTVQRAVRRLVDEAERATAPGPPPVSSSSP